MSSYNSINRVTATENELLETPLKSEWGFDGVVVSDWTAVRSLESAKAAQDLVMPGPEGPWGEALVKAVRAGDIDESVVDQKVLRILRLAQRVGALDGSTAAEPVLVEDGLAFAREAAAEGTVLLANDGILPLDAAGLRRVAVIGQRPASAHPGRRSATVIPERVVSPLEALAPPCRTPKVTYALGRSCSRAWPSCPRRDDQPATGEPGALVRFLDADGNELYREDRRATALIYFGGDAPIRTAATFEVSLTWTPETSGEVLLGYAATGRGRVFVDGELRREDVAEAEGMDLGAVDPRSARGHDPGDRNRRRRRADRVRPALPHSGARLGGIFGITVGLEPDVSDPQGLIDEAVRAASERIWPSWWWANAQVESEGIDRKSLALPGRQDDLVAAVAATGTPTVVVINAGAPVLLPWRDQGAALLVSYFGGQEKGHALADVLFGAVSGG